MGSWTLLDRQATNWSFIPAIGKVSLFLEDALRFIEVQKLYGVILTPSVSEDENLAEALRSVGCAYIRIASIALDMESRMIVTNDRVGGKYLADHLVGLGHKRIAWVEGRRSFRSSTERIAGFKDGLADHGIFCTDPTINCAATTHLRVALLLALIF